MKNHKQNWFLLYCLYNTNLARYYTLINTNITSLEKNVYFVGSVTRVIIEKVQSTYEYKIKSFHCLSGGHCKCLVINHWVSRCCAAVLIYNDMNSNNIG